MITLHSNGTIDGLAAGTIPAASIEDAFSSGAINIGGIRIVTGSETLDGSAAGPSSDFYYNPFSISYSGFAAAPTIMVTPTTGYHDAFSAGYEAVTTTGATVYISCKREAGVEGRTFTWVAIGESS
tara:strand:- start:249 stop:626 length:378 start_codon:yes stop_codon:yes gene_type:complete